jgi:hypothetical protein
VLAASALLVAAMLGVFAYSLADSQRQARRDVEKRFRDRAQVSAVLTSSLFASSVQAGAQTASTQLAAPRLTSQAAAAYARRTQVAFVDVYDARGSLLASSPGAQRLTNGGPLVQAALRGGFTVSDLTPGPHGQLVTEFAISFPGKTGARVEVSGTPETLLATFLAAFLSQVPNVAGSTSFVVDGQGRVVGAAGPGHAAVGRPLSDSALLAKLRAGRASGSYDGDRYFTSTRVAGTPWQVVVTARRGPLYASVNGSRRTVPWLIFAAFALTAALGLFLLRRVIKATTELERRELSQRHAVEINDNIIQRLVLAKYALDRGASETSQDKLAETLNEAQRLVGDLLEEEIAPGDLRRRGPASITDR